MIVLVNTLGPLLQAVPKGGFALNSNYIYQIAQQVLAGDPIAPEQAIILTQIPDQDVPLLAAYAHKIRHHFSGDQVEMCGVISARSGLCSEDCRFCSQSIHHTTGVPVYPLSATTDLLTLAVQAQSAGAKRVSLVTSGKGMEEDADFSAILATIKTIIAETGLNVCANLGTITVDQACALAAAGVKRYAHNLETSRHFFPSVCTTHSYDERLAAAKAAQQAGLELCCGGIVGLGESWQDRIDLAFSLQQLSPASVPLNILNPIKGTALENQEPLAPLEIIKIFALFRFILPTTILRPAGGREINLRDMQGSVMLSGANGLIIGNYLTFSGRDCAADFQMIKDAGLTPL